MKYMYKYILVICLLFTFLSKVNALSLSENELSIKPGNNKTVELYANTDSLITSVEFTLVYSTYDIPGNFYVSTDFKDSNPSGVKHKVIFNEPKTGKILLGTVKVNAVNNPKDLSGTININNPIAYTENNETINLNFQSIKLTVINSILENDDTDNLDKYDDVDTSKENTLKEENKNLLKEINSDIVKIELKKDVLEYEVSVSEEVLELDLKPVAIDDSYKIDISNQKLKELKDNLITIKVSNDDIEEEYKIKVKIKDKSSIKKYEQENIKNNDYKGEWLAITGFFLVILIFGLLLTKRKK